MGRSNGLRVWHAARAFARDIARLGARLPARTPPKLRVQIITSSRSASNCIAEGAGRGVRGEKLHYMRMARGSIEEAQDQLLELDGERLIDKRTYHALWNRSVVIYRMLTNLMVQLERGRG